MTAATPLRSARASAPSARVVTLTPVLAASLLAANPRNRDKSNKNYGTVLRAIERGEWKLNGEAIKVTADGVLLDGQHRCMAVVDSGISIETFLIEGLPADTQDTMDTGKARSLSDVLQIHGEVNANGLAALIRKFRIREQSGLAVAAGTNSGGTFFTIRELLDWLAANPWVREYVAPGKAVSRSVPMSGSTAGFLMRVFDEIDRDDSEFFWARLADGIDLSGTHPIYALRKALNSFEESVKGERNQRYLAAITVKAWNAYRAGDEVSLLRFRTGGAKPEAFPEPR